MVKQNPNSVRCINRQRNKVQYFSKHLVNDARWRKMTGYEPQPVENDPVTIGIQTPPNLHELGESLTNKQTSLGTQAVQPVYDMEAEIQRRVDETLAKYKLDKPKRKYTKKA